MINKCLALFLCLGLTGCALPLGPKYSDIYGNSLNAGEVTTVVKSESYQALKRRIAEIIVSRGYTNVVYENPKQGFIVFAKEGYAHPYQIIFKYTALKGEFKTSIDLVDGSNDVITDSAVYEDIREIANQIDKDRYLDD